MMETPTVRQVRIHTATSILAAGLVAVTAHAASSPSYQSSRQVIDNGCRSTASANYRTRVSIGQALVGSAASANYKHGLARILVGDMPPTITITSPSDGATVSETVTITAAATDDVGLVMIELEVIGAASMGNGFPATPAKTQDWDSTGVANGSWTILATATDTASQTATDSITINVQNPTVADALSVWPTAVYFHARAGSHGYLTKTLKVTNISTEAEPLSVSIDAGSLPGYLFVTPTSFALPKGLSRTVYVQMDPSVLPSDRSSPFQRVGALVITAEGCGGAVQVDVHVGLEPSVGGFGCAPGAGSTGAFPFVFAALAAWLALCTRETLRAWTGLFP